MLQMFVLRPPLPALIGVAMLLGVAECGRRIAPVFGPGRQPVDYGVGFMIATACLCAMLHPLVWIGIPHLIGVLRVIGWTIGIIGLISLPAWIARLRHRARCLVAWWRELAAPDRALAILIGVILFAYFLIVLGPAWDTDSLDYHLGAPLDWMLHGAIYPRWDWTQAHLVGLGEMVSMLGLAAGTDGLGALFEFASLLIEIGIATTFARNSRQGLMGALMVVGCPVMLQLALWQKPELMPAVAMTAALVLAAREWETIRPGTLAAIFVLIGFATSCKYSFILTAPVAVVIALIAARRVKRVRSALLIGIGAMLVLPAQVWLRNYILYQDPISPMLEFLKARPHPLGLAEADFVRSIKFFYLPVWKLPLAFIFVTHPLWFQGILGFGLLGLVLIVRDRRLPVIRNAAIAVGVILLLFTQWSPRFFIELYLLIAVLVPLSPDGIGKAAIKWLVGLQGIAIAANAIYYAAVLFPGALTASGRDYAMQSAIYYYRESLYLNRQMPHGVVLTMTEAHALVRPPFRVMREVLIMSEGPASPQSRQVARDLSDGQAAVAYLPQELVEYFIDQDHAVAPCFAEPIGDYVHFNHHPLRWLAPSDKQAWRLFRLEPGCVGGKPEVAGTKPRTRG
jgi:Protein of unknown function (DUF1420)/Dolichyl-phosphate-mannose-protein mannosyltransferase